MRKQYCLIILIRILRFIQKKIDGRFRIRVSKHMELNFSNCKISWKRRLGLSSDGIQREEEVEVKIDYKDYDSLMYLLNDVTRMKRIESYERYRRIFSNLDVEICVDKFPFGIALEIEQKKDDESSAIILEWIEKLGLDLKDSYRLSCDDKYNELCLKNGITPKKDILFNDNEMPVLKS